MCVPRLWSHGLSRFNSVRERFLWSAFFASFMCEMEDTQKPLFQDRNSVWQGCLALKEKEIPIRMYYVSGNSNYLIDCLPFKGTYDTRFLSFKQIQKIKQVDLVTLNKKLNSDEHCILIGLPNSSNGLDKYEMAQKLKGSFVDYLNRKKSIGITYLYERGEEEETFVLYVFPNCEYTQKMLTKIFPKDNTLQHTAYVLFIIVKS
ncbi:CLUMA_CG014204, isoform B [Nephila pilipes]|uniref:CLUMA_CG014204, isoform B n=1 Tax=Nephila pilipes TaxID=299642 RepID=A0A8X6QIC0_NEPPI|nr:CLUMA_CG014204, isoform B [Nephila pilipes]